MNTPLRCLIVEDSEDDALLVLRSLRDGGYDVTSERVDTPEAMHAALAGQPWDLVISDYKMPRFSGTAALELLKASGLDLPFIIVSGTIGEDQAVEAMRAGAHDYLMKGKLARLAPAVQRELQDASVRCERRRGESQLNLFRTLVGQSNDSFIVIDPETSRLLDFNEQGCLSRGYSREEFLALSVLDIDPMVGPDDFTKVVVELREKGVRTWQGLHRRKDGSTFPVEVNLKYVRLDRDYIVAAVRDITERKQVEAERQRLVAIIEATTDFVGFSDPTGHVLYMNHAGRKMIGTGPDEDVTKATIADLITDPANNTTLTEGVPAAIRDGQWSGETVLLSRDGRKTPVSQVILAHKSPGGKLEFLSTIMRDITERKRAEDELRNTQEELLKASRQAGIAEFASGVLHNVGNVLNSVNVATACLSDSLKKSKSTNLAKVVALMREHEADLGAFFTSDPKGKQVPGFLAQLAERLAEEQTSALAEIGELQKKVEHIKNLITGQQDSSKMSGRSEALKVTDLVEDALKMNANGLTRAAVQVSRKYQEVPPITTEKDRVLQILVNLVRNAVQSCEASGDHQKQLTVHVGQDADRVQISVADNGGGISAENLSRIFAHGFTTKKDGHGFGLHSAALAAKEMGGSLTVHSDGTGRGATFTLALPMKG